MDCVFCAIINGEISSSKVYEDDMILAFDDINPVAPVHTVIVPKEHICCANKVDESNSKYVQRIFEKIPGIAKAKGIDSYRIINNCGEDAGQTVKHLHFHLVGGVKMGEKII